MRYKKALAVAATVAIVAAVVFAPHRGPANYYPPSVVTGVTNPMVTQDTIATTICVSGWTVTIRPSASYTTALKIKQMAQFGFTGGTANFEEDHLISLELGGNPTDPANLWPESYPTAHLKDLTENYLKAQVCNGSMTLQEAQKEITTDWYAVYTSKVSKTPSYGSVDNIIDSDDL